MNIKKGLMIGLAALGFSMSASAVSVGGVVWDPTVGADFDAGSSIFEGALNPGPDGVFFTADDINTTVSGYGKINDVNGSNSNAFCPSGCELTFEFGGFELLKAADPLSGDFVFAFTGGWVNWYVDDTPNMDTSNPATLNASQANDGDLWLSMAAINDLDNLTGLANVSLSGIATVFGTGGDTGTGAGLLEVAYAGDTRNHETNAGFEGMANSHFDTNTLLTDDMNYLADMFFSSTFGPAQLSNITTDGMVLEGDADFSGKSIPEPTSIALLALGLLGFAARRKA